MQKAPLKGAPVKFTAISVIAGIAAAAVGIVAARAATPKIAAPVNHVAVGNVSRAGIVVSA